MADIFDMTGLGTEGAPGQGPVASPQDPPYQADEDEISRLQAQGDPMREQSEGLLKMWNARAESAEEAERAYHVEAQALTAYAMGFQHLEEAAGGNWRSVGFTIRNIAKPSWWTVFVTKNLFRQFILNRQAMMLGDMPTAKAMAANDSDQARTNADIATQLLRYYDYRMQALSMWERLESCRCNVGVGFIIDGWNPDGWAEVHEAEGQVELRQVGAMTTEIAPPWELLWQPGRPVSQSDWFIRRQKLPLSHVRELYKPRGYYVAGNQAATEDSSVTGSADLDQALLQSVGRQASTTEEPGQKFVDVYEGYERVPGRQGRDQWKKVTWCEEILLHLETLNWDPVVPVVYQEVLGYTFPVGEGRFLRGAQDRLNRRLEMNEEHLNRAANPPILKHITTQVSKGTLTGEPAELIEWSGDVAPSYLEVPRLSPEAMNAPLVWENAMRDVTGIHHVTQADLPQQNMSGVAVKALQGQAIGNAGFAVRNLHAALAKHYRNVIVIHREHGDVKRWLAIEGAEAAGDVESFVGTDLIGVEQVRFGVTSGIPMTPDEKLGRVYALQGMGLFEEGREKERDDFLEYLGIEEIRREPTLEKVGKEIARREQRQLVRKGQIDPPSLFEPATAMLETHRRFLLSEEFKRLPENVKKEFVLHFVDTQKVIRAQGMIATAEQAMMAGGGMGMGGGMEGAPGEMGPEGQDPGAVGQDPGMMGQQGPGAAAPAQPGQQGGM